MLLIFATDIHRAGESGGQETNHASDGVPEPRAHRQKNNGGTAVLERGQASPIRYSKSCSVLLVMMMRERQVSGGRITHAWNLPGEE